MTTKTNWTSLRPAFGNQSTNFYISVQKSRSPYCYPDFTTTKATILITNITGQL